MYYVYIYIQHMYYLLHTKYSVCCHVWKHHVGEASFPIGVAVKTRGCLDHPIFRWWTHPIFAG